MKQLFPDFDRADREESARLEGPPPEFIHADDAAHWVAVYEELVETMERLIGAMREARPATPVELTLLESRAAFFKRRLQWWRAAAPAGVNAGFRLEAETLPQPPPG